MGKNKTSDRCIWLLVILWLICPFFMFSCKTKKVITNEQKESHVKTEQLYTSVLGVSVDSTGVFIRNVNIIRYRYSKPDSAGKQHVEEVEKIVIDDKQQSDVKKEIKDTTSIISKKDTAGVTKTQIVENSESLITQLTKFGTVIIVAAIIFLFVYFKMFKGM